MPYATVDDLADYVTPPPNAPLLLARASRVVDQTLLCARYDPDDPDVQAALREATCEQVAAWVADGTEDGTGASPTYANVSIGSVTLGGRTGGAGAGRASATQLAPQAWMVLSQAGLTGHAPQVPGGC
ncbi:hypothetical protein GCM10017673_14900 [Streptosporangium violaceochromogenes]|nr:hypothetical protein GCM10017673_14900 [Streptosporangium violaceochromogenes]